MRANKKHIPFHQRLVQGAIGKRYVIKHYGHRVVKTRFPDMTGISASKKQAACRDAFKERNARVKAIYNDPVARLEWQQKLGKPPRLYSAIFKALGKITVVAKAGRQRAGSRMIKACFEGRPLFVDEAFIPGEIAVTGWRESELLRSSA